MIKKKKGILDFLDERFYLLKSELFYSKKYLIFLAIYLGSIDDDLKKDKILNSITIKDFKYCCLLGSTLLMGVIAHNRENNLGYTKKDIINIMNQCDISKEDRNGNNVVFHIIRQNLYNGLEFNSDDLIQFLDRVNINKTNNFGLSILTLIFENNMRNNLKFTQRQLIEIAKMGDTKNTNDFGENFIFSLIKNNQRQLFLDREDFFSIINNINLNLGDLNDYSGLPVLYYLENPYNDFNFTKDDILLFYKKYYTNNHKKTQYFSKNSIETSFCEYSLLVDNNILFHFFKNGGKLKNQTIIRELLLSKDKITNIILYKNIEKINFEYQDIVDFLGVNKFPINDKIASIFN